MVLFKKIFVGAPVQRAICNHRGKAYWRKDIRSAGGHNRGQTAHANDRICMSDGSRFGEES